MSQSEAQAVYMVHYGEIALKGRNRIDFERQLIANLKAQYPIHRAYRLPGRIVLEGPSGLNLTKTFGVVWWSEAVRVPSDKSAIAEALLPLAEQVGDTIQTFAVRVTQGERVFEESTPHLEAEFGGLIDRAFDWRVDLSQPDRTFYIEVMRRAAYLYTQRHPGPRGLPVGASGRLLGLFSGGVDSVLAAYLMAKRGAEIELVHFYAMADAGQAHQAKIGALAQALAAYLPSLKIHYFPYHLFQLATSHLVSREQRHELVLFRRFMARLAEHLAIEQGAGGLFSGDNLGQVASQTLENLASVDLVIKLPIFRPLIAYDKVEIIDLARRLDLLEPAEVAYKDCCSILATEPSTRARPEILDALERQIEIENLISETLSQGETITLRREASGELVTT